MLLRQIVHQGWLARENNVRPESCTEQSGSILTIRDVVERSQRRFSDMINTLRKTGKPILAMALFLFACGEHDQLPSEPIPFDGAELHYTSTGCFVVYPSRTEGALPDTLGFECGVIHVEFQDSTAWEDARTILASIPEARIRNWFPAAGDLVLWVSIHVRVGKEKPAIEKARGSPHVRRANLVHKGEGQTDW
jgi:hypothetical protein